MGDSGMIFRLLRYSFIPEWIIYGRMLRSDISTKKNKAAKSEFNVSPFLAVRKKKMAALKFSVASNKYLAFSFIDRNLSVYL
jgi:hypothetical protein